MYKFLPLLLLLQFSSIAQDSEPGIQISLALQPVVSMFERADGWIEVVSTDRIALRYSEREILLSAGAWRFRPDLDWGTFLQAATQQESGTDSDRYTRVVSQGLFKVDLLTGVATPVDYIEVSVCDGL